MSLVAIFNTMHRFTVITQTARLSPSRLLRVVAANDCINQQCNKTLAIPSTENQKITFQPCDACTKCPNSTPRTIQAWWYYYYVNGTRTDDIRALTIEERQYQINVSC